MRIRKGVNMNRKEYAVELKHNGHNCTQAVLGAFQEESGFDKETLMKIGAPFCAGMGCMEATCGALIAAEMLMGLRKYEGRPILKDARELYRNFEEKCGATLCRDLKGIGKEKVLCECDDCVRNAVELVERLYDK